jgi:hypothetical protein
VAVSVRSKAEKRDSTNKFSIGVGVDLGAEPISFEYKPSLIGKWSESEYQRKKVHYGFNADTFPIKDLVSQKDNGFLGLDHVEIIPFLVCAIQGLHEELEKLKTKVS